MSSSIGHRVLNAAGLVLAALFLTALGAIPGLARGDASHEVRRPVDFTVLPMVLPDGTEAPAQETAEEPDADSNTPEAEPAQGDEAAGETPPPPTEPETTVVEEPAAAAPQEQATAPADIGPISIEEMPGALVITVPVSHRVAETSFMNLDDPRRLAIDLHGHWSLTTENVIRSNGAVRYVVAGEHPDRLRLVVHFRKAPDTKLTPRFALQDNAVTISVPLQ